MQEQTQVDKIKDLRLSSTEKLAKERWMYVNSNSKTLKILNAFTFGAEEYYPKC